MENIQKILDKLNGFSAKETPLSAIELDLMLDYTRRLYDVLLSKKEEAARENSQATKEYPAQPSSSLLVEAPITTATPKEKFLHETIANSDPQAVSDSLPAEKTETFETEGHTIHTEGSHLNEPQTAAEREETEEDIKTEETAEKPAEGIPAEELSKPASEADTYEEDAERELEKTLYRNKSNISFEPPHPAEEEPFFPEEGIEEDAAEENDTPVQDIPVPLPEEDNFYDYARIFNYASQPADTEKGDIRKKIGINDKYLFLNELFNSQKKEYEAALDYINNLPDYQQALTWIKKEIAPTYKWYEDDETVQGFYEVLAKHFSAR